MDDLEEKLAEYKSAVQMLAASNAQLCEIALAADKLVEAVERSVKASRDWGLENRLEGALLEYKIARGGH